MALCVMAVLAGLLLAVLGILVFSCAVLAARSDRILEKFQEENTANQKEKPEQ